MSYTRLKSLFGRLSRRNSSASDTSRPTSPAPSLSLRPGSPAHAHSPLHNDSDAPSPSRLVSTARSTTALFTPSPERDREPAGTEENHQAQAYIPTQTIPGSESPSRADSDAPTFVTAQTASPTTPTANQPKPLPSGDQPPPPLPVQRRPTTQRRHTSAVVLSSSLPPTSSSASPIPTATPRRRRPTSLALRASSLGRYPVTNEANQTCEVTSESVSVGSYYEHVRAASDSVADRQKSVMSSVEREEERGGGVGKGTGRREWERDQEGKRGRVREGRFVDNEGGENEHGKREGSDSTTYSTRGIPEVGHVNMSGAGSGVPSGGGGGIQPPPGRSNRALSFLQNWTKRARPTLGASNSGAGSKGEATLGRRVSGLFEGVKADFDTPPPPPPAISTSSALVQYTTAGTFVHGPTTTAISTATSRPFVPDLDSLPPQPIEVLILAITTPPGPEESQSFYSAASSTPYSGTPHTTHPSLHYHPTQLANQLARQLRNPTNQRGVGAGPVGVSGSALVGAGVLADVVKSLRKAGARGAWDVVAAWVEGSGKNNENGVRRTGESGAEAKGGGTTIERALLWSVFTVDDESAAFDPEEWAERDRAARALTNGGRDVLGLHRFVGVVGKWVERACVVVSSENPSSNSASNYAEAQKCIDASLRLLEDVLRYNAPRFDEPQVVQVMEIFCGAVGKTMGGWEGGAAAIGSGDEGYIGAGNTWIGSAGSPGGGSGIQTVNARQGQLRGQQNRQIHRRHPSSLSSPLASPSTMRMPDGGEVGAGEASRSGTMDTSRSATLDVGRSYTQDTTRSNTQDAGRIVSDNLSAPYVVTASRFVALVRALQRWTHVPPSVLQMMLEYLALVLAYVKTPMEVLRLGGKRRRSGAGLGGKGGVGSDTARGDVDWVDAYSRAELEGEVSGAFKVLLSGPYAVAVGRMLLGLLVPSQAVIDDALTRSALISLGAARAIRLSVREAAIPRMARTRFQREVSASWTMSGAPSMGPSSDHVSSAHVPSQSPKSTYFSGPGVPSPANHPLLSSAYSSRRGSAAGIDVASDAAEMELMELMFNKESDGANGAWETDRIVGVLGAAFSAWTTMLLACGMPVEAVLVEMLGIADDLLQEAAEDEKAFGIEEGRVVGEVVSAAVNLFPLYSPGQEKSRMLDIIPNADPDTPSLNLVLQTVTGVIRKIGLSTPINPPMITTLFGKSEFLTDYSAVSLIRHYVSMSLITPSTPGYLDNLRQLFDHFYKPERHMARVELAQVISKLYFGVRDLAEYRRGVVNLCLDVWEAEERSLVHEQELQVASYVLPVLGDAIVAGSVESDGRGKIEERLRLLVALVGRDARCPNVARHEVQPPPEAAPPPEGRTRTRDSSPTPMMTLLNALTPSVLTPRELPPESNPPPRLGVPQSPQSPPTTAPPPTCVEHLGNCKAMAAVVTLIKTFSALAFSPPHSLSSTERTARAPASFQCILVMRDLLGLLSPVRGDSLDPEEEAAEERSRIIDGQSCCSFARLAILQWLVRLRADRDHRLYMVKDLDKEIEPFACLINRTPNKPRSHDVTPAPESRVRDRDRDREKRSRGMTTTTPAPEAVRIGRAPSRGRASDSRSRSRQPPPRVVQPIRQNIWSVPETVPFDIAFGTRPSEGMTTYEQRIEPSEDGLIPQLWLPVSAYVCIMIDLLSTETDWEILSYALIHMPVQISNKHLFCGPRTRNAIIRLISELCTVVHDDKLTANIGPLPPGLKVTDVQGLAYHTLTTLMSYHRTFDKPLQDALLRTFIRGLNKNTTTVKPCLQALAIAAFELQPSTTKFLGEIVDKLSQIMSNPTIAGYILELLCIIGSIPALYANFTEDNYRRIFHVPLQYITLHNRPDSHAGPAGKESYALTQHVLILAYYQIYVWFLALKLQDRPKHIPYITRNLLIANEHYDQVDEPTEVCFDWLARFTYANAESKPRTSSLRESVVNPPGSSGDGVASSKSWVFGNSIITIKTLRHSGWLEIECRRPSGLSTFLCKLQNIAALGLGEQVTGEIVEAATEALSREPSQTSEQAPGESTPGEPDVPASRTSVPSGLLSPSGIAAPKEMEIDPSYFALQLSPYPDVRRASLRGRLVANDDLLNRTLRGLDRVPVMDFHTVGILYVGPGQTNEREILGNRAGSPAYTHFLDNIGRLIKLKDQKDLYTGGLDSHYDSDGQYAYAWWDVIGQLLYHTATLMPNREGDDQFASKKLHIGNDYVRVIWNDSGKPYRFDTLSTQFQYVNIVIEPHSVGKMAAFTSNAHQDEFFKVLLQRAPGMPEFGMIGEFKIVSAKCLPNIIRQTSMLADFFAQIYVHTQHDTRREEYVTPWRQRLRQIRMFKSRLPNIPVEELGEGILGQEVARDFSRSY